MAEATLIVIGTWDNHLRIYDEKKVKDSDSNMEEEDPYGVHDDHDAPPTAVTAAQAEPKEPKNDDDKLVLRHIDGEHFKDLIVCMTVSKHHSLIATGSQSGLVTLWELETGRCNKAHIAARANITFLQFMDKYPILMAGGSMGYCSLWVTKGAPMAYRHQCLGRFQNQNITNPNYGDIPNEGISCGALSVLQVDIAHQIFASDQIQFDKGTFSLRTALERKDQKPGEQEDSDYDT